MTASYAVSCRHRGANFSNFSQAAGGSRHYLRLKEGIQPMTQTGFMRTLHSGGPAPDRANALDLYGRFVGDWRMAAAVHADDGSVHHGAGEIHFGWVLQGRAIQDVWILPDVFYGSTLRIFDPGLGAWHILWSDPVRQYYARQVGRADGDDIVQVGRRDDGAILRWRFTEIRSASFHWLGERLADDGATWQLQADFRAERV
jgi:hypothetical protein